MNKYCAIYARVSTRQHGQDPQMQVNELKEYCQRRGWTVKDEYVDAGISGTKEKRPQLDRMLKDCRQRKIDAVVVYRYDRFARSLKQLVNTLDEFHALGVEFVSIHEGTDTTTPAGKLVFQIFGAISEFERTLIAERVRSGIAHARSKGTKLGRPEVTVDIATVRKLRAQGIGWKKIAAQLQSGKGTILKAAKQHGIA
jgi:DNA invertase Pin-like site-specific DNA recombinase